MEIWIQGSRYEGRITAIQMDIKIHGLTRPIVEEAIAKTKDARMYILNEIMIPCISQPRPTVGEYRLRSSRPRSIRRRLAMLWVREARPSNTIIEQTGVKIDISDDGFVSICGTIRR